MKSFFLLYQMKVVLTTSFLYTSGASALLGFGHKFDLAEKLGPSAQGSEVSEACGYGSVRLVEIDR